MRLFMSSLRRGLGSGDRCRSERWARVNTYWSWPGLSRPSTSWGGHIIEDVAARHKPATGPAFGRTRLAGHDARGCACLIRVLLTNFRSEYRSETPARRRPRPGTPPAGTVYP